MTDIIYSGLFFLLIIKLLLTMYHKRYTETGQRKRITSLYQSVYLGVLYIIITIIQGKGFSLKLIYPILVLFIIGGVLLRKTLFPYTLYCKKCHKKLGIEQILFKDTEVCSDCDT